MITGNLSRMGQLQARLRDLAEVPSRAARRVSEDLSVLIQEEFDAGADPYGREWDPLADATRERGRTEPPLTDSGAMRGGIRVAPLPGAGVGVTLPHPAEPHQTGWSGPRSDGPSRPILPSGVMPARWREVIMDAVESEVRR